MLSELTFFFLVGAESSYSEVILKVHGDSSYSSAQVILPSVQALPSFRFILFFFIIGPISLFFYRLNPREKAEKANLFTLSTLFMMCDLKYFYIKSSEERLGGFNYTKQTF
jgi:hypothetical protein